MNPGKPKENGLPIVWGITFGSLYNCVCYFAIRSARRRRARADSLLGFWVASGSNVLPKGRSPRDEMRREQHPCAWTIRVLNTGWFGDIGERQFEARKNACECQNAKRCSMALKRAWEKASERPEHGPQANHRHERQQAADDRHHDDVEIAFSVG